ncbi:hypothetical protein BSLG_005918 [Batrachochytrium salamandrivorans]|nr:hypothetical protein BSLG_005918 [Batrachochytrium salamandrivorans]
MVNKTINGNVRPITTTQGMPFTIRFSAPLKPQLSNAPVYSNARPANNGGSQPVNRSGTSTPQRTVATGQPFGLGKSSSLTGSTANNGVGSNSNKANADDVFGTLVGSIRGASKRQSAAPISMDEQGSTLPLQPLVSAGKPPSRSGSPSLVPVNAFDGLGLTMGTSNSQHTRAMSNTAGATAQSLTFNAANGISTQSTGIMQFDGISSTSLSKREPWCKPPKSAEAWEISIFWMHRPAKHTSIATSGNYTTVSDTHLVNGDILMPRFLALSFPKKPSKPQSTSPTHSLQSNSQSLPISQPTKTSNDRNIAQIVSMGFDADSAAAALEVSGQEVAAIDILVQNQKAEAQIQHFLSQSAGADVSGTSTGETKSPGGYDENRHAAQEYSQWNGKPFKDHDDGEYDDCYDAHDAPKSPSFLMYREAIADCTQASGISSNDLKGLHRRACACEAIEMWTEALKDYRMVMETGGASKSVSEGIVRCNKALQGSDRSTFASETNAINSSASVSQPNWSNHQAFKFNLQWMLQFRSFVIKRSKQSKKKPRNLRLR